jgi:hypothetical protein
MSETTSVTIGTEIKTSSTTRLLSTDRAAVAQLGKREDRAGSKESY